jgi:hypothetical protein
MILPEEILYEVLGKKPHIGFDPGNSNFFCPFIDSRCTKKSTQDKAEPYPVCAISTLQYGPICVCPQRFRQHKFLQDVMNIVWPGLPYADLSIANEVTMKGFGRVDHVISEVRDGKIQKFVSVELQAIDFNGSVRPVYDEMRKGNGTVSRPKSGPNWKNVSKRYINQLISKGFFHHHWGTKIYAAIQDKVYDYFRKDADFPTFNNPNDPNLNVVFMIYSLEDDPTSGSRGTIRLDRVEATHHSNLQNAVLYKSTPNKQLFETAILSSLRRR